MSLISRLTKGFTPHPECPTCKGGDEWAFGRDSAPRRNTENKGATAVKPWGSTLLELMISIILISILVGSIWLVFNVGSTAYYSQWRRSGVKGEAGRAFTRLVNELHLAENLTSAQAVSLTFTADTDYNGVDETITYSWSGTAGAPFIRTKSAPSPVENLTLVNSVNNLAFTYYAANNTILSFPVTLSSAHLVAVNITASDSSETFFLRTKANLENI